MPQSNVPVTVLPLSNENERLTFGGDISFHDGKSELSGMKGKT
jgi:hypothetical protein